MPLPLTDTSRRAIRRALSPLLMTLAAILAFVFQSPARATETEQAPNILLILADDLGYSDLACYGGEMETPHIDALAQRGVRFTQFYNSARCCPSRASLMTGLYPSQAGIGDFTTARPHPRRGPGYLGRLNDRCATLAEVLKPAGYGCYYVGKWHLHEQTGPIRRGFDEFYGYTRGHSHDQYDADYYIRLPEGRRKEIDPPADQFYATDVFNEYALEFIRQGQQRGKPWFLFLGHSSPHFPVQAPAERADKYEATYQRGWDVLRQERFERMRALGLVDGDHWTLTPRSLVPVDRQDIANGFSGRPNPAWDSLDGPRRRDLARRMAVFAAMVEAVDQGVGRIVEHLRETGDLDNTLILFLSDNGACYEWGPFGFDGPSRQGRTDLRTGDELRRIGGPGTHQSYGSGWANLGNTPFRLYKHFTHEGGISTPCIVHWPRGLGEPGTWLRQPAHVMDVMPTLLEVSGGEYPRELRGNPVTPLEGRSLLPALRGQPLPDRSLGFDHQAARALRKGDWKLVWSKRMPHEIRWELYNLAEDRCETRDLASKHPDRVNTMAAEWDRWARHVQVIYEPEDGDEPKENNGPAAHDEAGSDDELGAKDEPGTKDKPGANPAPRRVPAERAENTPPIVDQWRYTSRPPGEDWWRADHDDSNWRRGPGGFGTRETPGARVGTVWRTSRIWLRKAIPLQVVPERPALLIHHDEDAEVYLNGRRVATLNGYTTDYKTVPLDQPQRSALRVGDNVLAVHCRQTRGGQFIDVHLVDAERVPTLPKPPPQTKPFVSELITRWGEQVTADNAWAEYPRPQMKRPQWRNLNGHWDYAITTREVDETPADWSGKILVPFCLESRLSGVQRLLDPSETLWYRRLFEAPPLDDQRALLHFEAVDYRCRVFVNGQPVGTHQGGHTPFSFDISEQLREGQNTLVVRVEDDTEGWQLRGKQVLDPRGIWYTRVSGIWQTVWLERVPRKFIRDLKITSDASAGTIGVRTIVDGAAPAQTQPSGLEQQGTRNASAEPDGYRVRVVVSDGDEHVAEAAASANSQLDLVVPDAKLWSPSSPHLYTLRVTLLDETGKAIDQVDSYAGIRSVGRRRDEAGHWRFTLNGQPIFHWGPLDQGWWPDGLLTPPSDEAMRFDIEFLKAAGFNMIRKHIKVEPRRYYYHCDRLGMLVWQDHVSGGAEPAWTRLQPDPSDAEWPDERHRQFMLELERMIDTLENHPSIVVWVPFNERWGQHRTLEVGRWLVERDPTRLVNIASGGNFWPVGHIVDAHRYPHPGFPFEQGEGGRFDTFIKVMGEFGGHGYPVPGHLWDAERRNWGYGGLPRTKDEYKERYVTSLRMLRELRAQGIAAGVYTQTTDVEGEINGLLTYDRGAAKIPAKELADLHRRFILKSN